MMGLDIDALRRLAQIDQDAAAAGEGKTTRIAIRGIDNTDGVTCDYGRGQCSALAVLQFQVWDMRQHESTAQVRLACEKHGAELELSLS